MHVLVRKMQQLRLFLDKRWIKLSEAQKSHGRSINPDNHLKNYMYLIAIHLFAFVFHLVRESQKWCECKAHEEFEPQQTYRL